MPHCDLLELARYRHVMCIAQVERFLGEQHRLLELREPVRAAKQAVRSRHPRLEVLRALEERAALLTAHVVVAQDAGARRVGVSHRPPYGHPKLSCFSSSTCCSMYES